MKYVVTFKKSIDGEQKFTIEGVSGMKSMNSDRLVALVDDKDAVLLACPLENVAFIERKED